MPWIGGLALLLCVPILLFTQRIYLPIAREPIKLLAPRLNGLMPHLPAHLDGFNLIMALILVIAAAACVLRRPGIVATAGAAILILTLGVYLEVAVGRAPAFAQLVREAAWLQDAYTFDFAYMPRNVASEPSLWELFRFDTVWDRLVTGWYFMGFGWNVAVAVGFTIFVAAIRRLRWRSRRRAIAFTVLAGFALIIFFLWGPVRGQSALIRGALAEAQGDPRKALQLYRCAAQRDGWLRTDLSLRQRIGGLELTMGRESLPDAQVFRAEQYVAQSSAPGAIGQLPKAIAIYGTLAAAGDEAAGLRANDLKAAYGVNLFSDGAFGGAVEVWESILARDRSMWLAKYYLSRAYFVVGRYQEAAAMSREALADSSDPRVVADLYSNLGDALIRLSEYDDAHLAYFEAYQIDYLGDFRGLASLVGP